MKSTRLIMVAATAAAWTIAPSGTFGNATVPGFAVESYAVGVPTELETLSFRPSGVLYVGNDVDGKIYRVPDGGGEYVPGQHGPPLNGWQFGPALVDPDAVFVDVDGSVSGVPGSVLVGGITGGQGYVTAITPDQDTIPIWGPTWTFANPTDFTFGCSELYFTDSNRNKVFHYDPGADPGGPPPTVEPTTCFDTPGDGPYRIAFDPYHDWIFTTYNSGRIEIHDCAGNVLNANGGSFGLHPSLTVGPGGVWGTDLYVANRDTGQLLRLEVLPNATLGEPAEVGTGFVGFATDMEFGPDDALYVSLHYGQKVLRIAVDCNTNGLDDAKDVAGGTSQDCNTNGTPDECDIADGTSEDENGNGVPDECEPVPLDIKPGSCPNPLNRNSHGVLSVALLGTTDFDATTIEVSSVRLSRADSVGGEVPPNEGPPGPHSVFEDVATPFEGQPCDCHALGGDGIIDLSMKFRTDDVVEALELNDLGNGDLVELIIAGLLVDGTEFTSAGDCILTVPQGNSTLNVGSSVPELFVEVTATNMNVDDSGFANFQRTYSPGTVVTLTAPATHDGLAFAGWKIDGTPIPSVSGTTFVTLVQTETTAEAFYVPASRLPKPAPTPTPAPRPAPRPVVR